jgi:hypothetical protein
VILAISSSTKHGMNRAPCRAFRGRLTALTTVVLGAAASVLVAVLEACSNGSGDGWGVDSGESHDGQGESGGGDATRAVGETGVESGPATDSASTTADATSGVDATLDAGTLDSGIPEGSAPTSPDGAPSCVTAGTELCDDFESGMLDPATWKVNKLANDGVTVETGLAHSGQYAVHLKLVAGQHNIAQITENVTFPASANAFYTRAFAYFSPDLPSGTGFHMGYIVASGNNDLGSVQAGLGSIGPKDYLGYSIYFGPPFHEFGPWASLTVAPKQWVCLELFESGAGGTGETRRIWVNGMELTDLRSTYDGQAPPQFDMVALGVWQYDGMTPTLSDIWLDDVRVSSRRIGCGP